ncbi:MAG: hypothetical protein ABI986_05000 [Chloroflexota bacterium]
MTPARHRILIAGLIVAGFAFVGFFGMRFFHAFRDVRGHHPHFPHPGSKPAETDVSLIRDWMTIGFLSHTYRTPPDVLYQALDIRPNGNEDKSLKQLNDEYFPDKPGYVLETVKAAIQANQPPLTTMPPKTAVPPSVPTP